VAEQRQVVERFTTYFQRSEYDEPASRQLADHLREHPNLRVVALVGAVDDFVAVLEPVPEERPIVLPPQCPLGGAP
jgi:hypothetical protein